MWSPTSAVLQTQLPADIRPGDAVMVKGSNGAKMSPVVAALRAFAVKQKSETPTC